LRYTRGVVGSRGRVLRRVGGLQYAAVEPILTHFRAGPGTSHSLGHTGRWGVALRRLSLRQEGEG